MTLTQFLVRPRLYDTITICMKHRQRESRMYKNDNASQDTCTTGTVTARTPGDPIFPVYCYRSLN